MYFAAPILTCRITLYANAIPRRYLATTLSLDARGRLIVAPSETRLLPSNPKACSILLLVTTQHIPSRSSNHRPLSMTLLFVLTFAVVTLNGERGALPVGDPPKA
jgi:hypothetical protein